jgi:hypothetical protein
MKVNPCWRSIISPFNLSATTSTRTSSLATFWNNYFNHLSEQTTKTLKYNKKYYVITNKNYSPLLLSIKLPTLCDDLEGIKLKEKT